MLVVVKYVQLIVSWLERRDDQTRITAFLPTTVLLASPGKAHKSFSKCRGHFKRLLLGVLALFENLEHLLASKS